jgi:hypothetical protein
MAKKRRLPAPDGFKVCTLCRETLPVGRFHKGGSSSDGLKSWCKACVARKDQEWHLNHPKQRSEVWMRFRYGIEPSEFSRLMAAQDNACAICRQPFGAAKMAGPRIDHDHESGIVRGLLCHNCNVGIACLKESRQVLLQAA